MAAKFKGRAKKKLLTLLTYYTCIALQCLTDCKMLRIGGRSLATGAIPVVQRVVERVLNECKLLACRTKARGGGATGLKPEITGVATGEQMMKINRLKGRTPKRL